MRKVLSFSLFLMLGLVASQLLPGLLGPGYSSFKATTDTLLYVCLGFIMINVGREFEIDKSRWRSYTADYFIAMARRRSRGCSSYSIMSSCCCPRRCGAAPRRGRRTCC